MAHSGLTGLSAAVKGGAAIHIPWYADWDSCRPKSSRYHSPNGAPRLTFEWLNGTKAWNRLITEGGDRGACPFTNTDAGTVASALKCWSGPPNKKRCFALAAVARKSSGSCRPSRPAAPRTVDRRARAPVDRPPEDSAEPDLGSGGSAGNQHSRPTDRSLSERIPAV